MKKSIWIVVILSGIILNLNAQEPVYLTFSSSFSDQWVQPESIRISNLTHEGDTILFWPDTVFMMVPVNTSELQLLSRFRIFQNTPNPVTGIAGTDFKVYLPLNGILQLNVTDVIGRKLALFNRKLPAGYNNFHLNCCYGNIYIISATFQGKTQSIKVISTSVDVSSNCSLEYISTKAAPIQKTIAANSNFIYYPGDSISMTGKFGQFSYTIIDTPIESTQYTFKFSEILSGDTQKTWKLLRNSSTGRFPLQVGPDDGSNEIWWALGLNQPIHERYCMMNDEWIFTSSGEMLFDAMGDYWAEGGIFHPDFENTCQPTTQMYGPLGEDLSVWGNGNHFYSITTENITVDGYGAYIGFFKTGTYGEVTLPQEQIVYNLYKLSEGTTDTLIVQCNFMAVPELPAYWRYVLVHYDDPSQEPSIYSAIADFMVFKEGYTVSFTNLSLFADQYLWDFGDGNTSTEFEPVHTYQNSGIYTITLTASNQSSSDQKSKTVYIFETVVTNELLIGAPWKVKIGEQTVFVGSELGSPDWWGVPMELMLPGGEWECLVNDEFIFSSDGNYEYRTNGDARNDGYMGGVPGCISDEELLASGNGAAFRSAFHTYNFYQNNDNPYIILTNGAFNTAAFVGFYKGYYGGENTDPGQPPNGGLITNRYELLGYVNDNVNEYLLISVDINGSAPQEPSWSYILERPVETGAEH